MDLDRITHPLRLARGSHRPGSGKGCAMNVISYIVGDARVTDFPSCSARPLSLLVQSCDDLLAGPDGYLSPEHSVLALELAWAMTRPQLFPQCSSNTLVAHRSRFTTDERLRRGIDGRQPPQLRHVLG